MWYPQSYDDCCKRRDCLYHSQSLTYACDFCFLQEHAKILDPMYERNDPPTAGCSLWKPYEKGYRKKIKEERMRRILQQAKAAKQLRKDFPHLYADDYKNQ